MNKKLVALALGAAITTGIGGFGTFAYFTDTQVVKDNVSITMGTLKGEANWTEKNWESYSSVTEANQTKANEGLVFTNVKPGDKFYREVVVENVGTLDADMSINLKGLDTTGLEVTYVVQDTEGNWSERYGVEGARHEVKAAKPGTKMLVRVEVSVLETLGNDVQGQNLVTSDAHDFITVGMHQTIE